jgi:hypothetical protein
MVSGRASQRAFFNVSALLFAAASAAATIVWCAFMSAMGKMRMQVNQTGGTWPATQGLAPAGMPRPAVAFPEEHTMQ